MYVCPTCGKQFAEEKRLVKHMSVCWKELHPYQKSKPASRGVDKETREVTPEIIDFFNQLGVKV